MHLDAIYYISNVLIPPLERIFSLVGADVRKWFLEMPKTRYLESNSPTKAVNPIGTPDRLNIEEHFQSTQCIVCGGLASQGKCIKPAQMILKFAFQACVTNVFLRHNRQWLICLIVFKSIRSASQMPTAFAVRAPDPNQRNRSNVNLLTVHGYFRGSERRTRKSS